MILLTGATGMLGRPLLRRLVAAGRPVRVFVRNPRRLGPDRVRVSIATGDLAGRHGVANAMRGIETVVHLGHTIRDQSRGSIEEINGLATSRLVTAAERAGVERFVFVTPLGASPQSHSRYLRAKALATAAVAAGRFEPLIFEASIIYAPDDPWLRLVKRLSRLPLMPVPGDGSSIFQPIWAEDAADAIMAALTRRGAEAGRRDQRTGARRVDLAGPDLLTHDQILTEVMRACGRRRPLVHLSPDLTRRLLRLQEWYLGPSAIATWDEAQLMEFSAVTSRGTADVEALGVSPRRLADVLAA